MASMVEEAPSSSSSNNAPPSLGEDISTAPMVGPLVSPLTLLPEYESATNPGFVPGIHYIGKQYTSMRRIRGDGNCFYRAFLFAYLESLLTAHTSADDAEARAQAGTELARVRQVVEASKDELVATGYSEMAIESFHDMLVALLAELLTAHTPASLLALFQEDGESDYYTWFMRLLTALSMRRQEERFAPFIMDPLFTDMASYCSREVEPMGKECEQVQVIALAEYLGARIRIEYMDGHAFDEDKGLNFVLVPEEGAEAPPRFTVCLLYRPGHYDVLYH